MNLTVEQVAAMAPDSASAAAGRKLAGVKHWAELGHAAGEALWGLCQGSAVYQVKVEVSTLGYNCSCPSRKFPCKHVLALLTIFAQSPDAVAAKTAPDWVTTWLAKRQAASEKKAAKAVAPQEEKPVDEKAQAKRVAQRENRVQQGLDQLDLWMRDLVRNGLAGVEAQSQTVWNDMAKRLVDASAPGLASRVERLSAIPGSSKDWPRRLLCEMGRLKLVLHAYSRLDQLDTALQADIRQTIGWNVSQDELQAAGEHVRDEWYTYAQYVDEEERVRAQRSWIVGRETGRTALVLQFAPGAAPFPEQIVAGSRQTATVAFYPGAASQRARFIERAGDIVGIGGRVPGAPNVEHYLDTVADAMARQPLLNSFGCVLHDVTLVPHEPTWLVGDTQGQTLPLVSREYWKIMALSGGRPFDVMGQWDGQRLRPLAMMIDCEYMTV